MLTPGMLAAADAPPEAPAELGTARLSKVAEEEVAPRWSQVTSERAAR